jgi:hypothetical protein
MRDVPPPTRSGALPSRTPINVAYRRKLPRGRFGSASLVVSFWPILLKKSFAALDRIFSASLARFHDNAAEGLTARRRRDVDRSKWNCEARNSQS